MVDVGQVRRTLTTALAFCFHSMLNVEKGFYHFMKLGERISSINQELVRWCERIIALALLFAATRVFPNVAAAAQDDHPLAPPDRSSPRATLKTFLDSTNKAWEAFKRGQKAEARQLIIRAARCMNLEKEAPSLRYVVGLSTTKIQRKYLIALTFLPMRISLIRKRFKPKRFPVGPSLIRRSQLRQ